MADKSPLQEFSENWRKRSAWASDQGIPASSVQPVMALDAQRLKNGDYIYSDAEAYRAIQASATMTDPTQNKPISASLNPFNVAGNFFSDMRNFYSGLGNLVVHPMGNLIDPLIHGVEELPHTAATAIHDIETGNWSGTMESLSQNTLLDFLPGVSDLGTLASQGIDGLIEHPFYSVIDVAPWSRILGRAGELAGLTRGEGVVGDVARQLADKKSGGFYGLGARTVGKIPIGRVAEDVDEAGRRITSRPTVGSGFEKLLQKGGFDKVSKDLFGFRGQLTEELQDQSKQLLTDLTRTTLGNSDIDADKLWQAVITGNRDLAPDAVKANDATWDTANEYLDSSAAMLQDIENQGIKTTAWEPYSHSYEVYSPSDVSTITRLEANRSAFNDAIDQANIQIANLQATRSVGRQLSAIHEVPLPRDQLTPDALQPEVMGLDKTPIGKTRPQGRELPGFQHIADNLRQYRQLLAQYHNNPQAISSLAYRGMKKITPQQLRVINDIEERLLPDVISTIDQGGSAAAIKTSLRALKSKLNAKFLSDVRRDPHGLLMTGPLPELRAQVDSLIKTGIDSRQKEIDNYNTVNKTVGNIEEQIQAITNKKRGLEKSRDNAEAEYHLWHINHPPARWTNLQRHILMTRQIARMYLQKEQYPMLAGQILDPKIVRALRDAMPDEQLGGASTLTVNDVHAALQASSMLTSAKANVTGENLVYLAKAQMLNPGRDATLTRVIKDNQDIFDKEFSEVKHTWHTLQIMGYNPAWVPTRTIDDVRKARRPFLSIDERGPGSLKNIVERNFRDINNSITDPNVALHAAAVDLLLRQKLIQFHEGMVVKLAKQESDVNAEWKIVANAELKRGSNIGLDPSVVKQQWVDAHYSHYFPEEYGIMKVDYDNFFHPEGKFMYLPKFIKDGIDKMQKSERGFNAGFEKSVVRGNSMFKSTLLTFSPRYAFHMSVGQAFMVSIKTSPAYLGYLATHFSGIKGLIDTGKVDPRVPLHTIYDDTAIPMHEYLSGKTMGRLLGESFVQKWVNEHGPISTAQDKAGALLNGFHDKVTMMNNMQRVAVLLYQVERGEKKGLSHEAAMEEALALTTKIFGDTRRMSPIERTITKTMVPFYGWTRTILGFALGLPIDNPWRVMILGNLSEQEQNDWNSSIPDNLKYLMFLGNPDKEGNVTAIDVRGIDPMRDVGTYFTAAGIMSVFSPYLQAPLDIMGINPETATPELYPGITYNDFYGTEQASGGGSQGVANAIEGIVPQASALDFAFGISNQMRYQRANDTKGFAYTLADYLNMPYLPQHINLRQEVARTSVDQYSVLEQQVENALQTNNFSGLMGYNAVPYRGWDMNPHKLAAISNQLEHEYGIPASQTLSQYVPYSRQAQGIDESNPATQPSETFPAVGRAG